MSTDDPFDPERRDEELLGRALHDEADQVETDPAALQKIQQRTGGGPRRSWLYAGIGAAAATAAVIAGVAIASDNSDPSSGPAPANQGPQTDQAPTNDAPTPTPDATTAATTAVAGAPTPLFYVGPRRLACSQKCIRLRRTTTSPDECHGWDRRPTIPTTRPAGRQGCRSRPSTREQWRDSRADRPADRRADHPGFGSDGGELAITALLFSRHFQTGGHRDVTYNGEPS